jgi:hypothetical protein
MSINDRCPAAARFAWILRQARYHARRSQLEVARAARLTLAELVAAETGAYVPPLWQVLLLADALELDRHALCRLAGATPGHRKKAAAAAGVSSRVPGQQRGA